MNVESVRQAPGDCAEPDVAAPAPPPVDRELARDRRRRIVCTVVAVFFAVAVLTACEAWRRSRRHWQALWHYSFLGAKASWSCDASNWRRGGSTEVVMGQLRPVTDADLRQLSSLHRLELLDLSNALAVTDAGLVHLRGLKDLKTLDLGAAEWNLGRGPQISDAGLAHLRGLNNLREISLNSAPITDAGLANLTGLVNLESLELKGTQVTDLGLKRLQALPRLRRLDVTGTGVTEAGVLAVVQRNRQLEVVSDFRSIDSFELGAGQP